MNFDTTFGSVCTTFEIAGQDEGVVDPVHDELDLELDLSKEIVGGGLPYLPGAGHGNRAQVGEQIGDFPQTTGKSGLVVEVAAVQDEAVQCSPRTGVDFGGCGATRGWVQSRATRLFFYAFFQKCPVHRSTGAGDLAGHVVIQNVVGRMAEMERV